VTDDAGVRGAAAPRGGGTDARRAFEAGRSQWPGVPLDYITFEGNFLQHAESTTPPTDSHVADMYLACACAEGQDEALRLLDRVLASDVARAVASVDASLAFVDDVLQATREYLLVRRNGQPGKIVEFGGRASLKSWLCTVAVRMAISRKRRKGEQHHEHLSAIPDKRLARGGPEFEYLRGKYKGLFEDAVRLAIERLQPKERMLLRLNVVDGMSIDDLAAMYKVGRSTAARWLANARRALLESARRDLRTRLQLSPEELESLAGDLRSQIEVSVLRLLARSGGSPRQ
jgi:RNA polymerase sigma-70 factor (ECF subfamily)